MMWTATWRLTGRGLQPVLKGANLLCSPLKRKRGVVTLPQQPARLKPTPQTTIDDFLTELDSKKDEWQLVSCDERAALLGECIVSLREVAREAAKAATQAHGSYGSGIGEEYSFWIPVALALNEYQQAMVARGQPSPIRTYQRDGQYVNDVFPTGMMSAMFGDARFEVWVQKGKEPTQGRVYRMKNSPSYSPSGRVSLVLGAGNHINVVLLDILHKLLCEDEVVVAKMNPQNEFLGVYVERALKPFFDRGFVKLVYGDVEEGSYLCRHPLVENIHLTGSIHTFNAIVYGTTTPTQNSQPVLEKKVTAELGCVTPMIVVPGIWSEGEMEYAANGIVAGLTSNSSHACCALECLVVSESWAQRQEFMEVLKKKLDEKECQVAWYKGSKERYEKFRSQFPDALRLGRSDHMDDRVSPWFLATGICPEDAQTRHENWCGVLQEVVLPSTLLDVAQFLKDAVDFCNERCWGTLSCSVLIDPKTQRTHSEAFQEAVAALRYGTIVVNAPPTFGFLPASTWGAYPGNPTWNIGSGNCMVHNTFLFDHPEKTVCYAPWQLHPVAIWADITNKEAVIDALMQFLQSPGFFRLLQVVSPALMAA